MIVSLSSLPQPTDGELFRYVVRPSYHPAFKLGYVISILAWSASLIGMVLFALKMPVSFVTFVPLALLLSAFYGVSIRNNLHYKKYDLRAHRQLVERYHTLDVYPTIDVFLPVCGEPIDVLRNTWEGVAQLDYPADRVCVYVLDDACGDATAALAQEFGFRYIRRPNRGEMKKAGNIKYGFEQSHGDFIIILDADFRPHPAFLTHTLPYMLDDAQIAIVQTPQYFDYTDAIHARSPLEYGAGNIQEYFYKIIQRSRAYFGAAICVGSCALYRRAALAKVGGTYQIEHSEDVWTGFSLVRAGYKLHYLPIIVSKGLCPDDANGHYKQQSRWATGSLSLATSAYFWKAPVPWRTRLPFFAGFLFYLSTIPFLLLHFAGHLLLWLHPQDLTIVSTLVTLVSWVNAYFLLRYHIYPNARYGTILAFMSAVWAYAFTVVNAFIFRRIEGWVPTGAARSLSPGFLRVVSWARIYLLVNCCCIVVSLRLMDLGNIHHYPMLLASAVFLALDYVYVTEMQRYIAQHTTTKEKTTHVNATQVPIAVPVHADGAFIHHGERAIG
jgi:cellulose synthase (UDP-forming)